MWSEKQPMFHISPASLPKPINYGPASFSSDVFRHLALREARANDSGIGSATCFPLSYVRSHTTPTRPERRKIVTICFQARDDCSSLVSRFRKAVRRAFIVFHTQSTQS
eukprot:g83076.t1